MHEQEEYRQEGSTKSGLKNKGVRGAWRSHFLEASFHEFFWRDLLLVDRGTWAPGVAICISTHCPTHGVYYIHTAPSLKPVRVKNNGLKHMDSSMLKPVCQYVLDFVNFPAG